ncbi:MAG: hypothetical protein JWP37_4647 [Mucilaginibacter sp.]|nr:hypothetical protein [Mucilaginibacter sp.]
MYLKKFLPVIIILFCITNCFAQDTLEKKNRLTDKVTEKFHVIKGNEQVKDGFYQALYKRKIAVASGEYKKGKKTGVWYFYDQKGVLLQIFNYSKDSLRYDAREDSTSDFRYMLDKEISANDKITKPVKIGGRYYGFLSYLMFYKTPFDPYIYGTGGLVGVVELLISPMGRLADYKIRVVSAYSDYDQTTNFDVRLLKEEDRKFIPATYNGEPVLSRIIIQCRVTASGGLDYF